MLSTVTVASRQMVVKLEKCTETVYNNLYRTFIIWFLVISPIIFTSGCWFFLNFFKDLKMSDVQQQQHRPGALKQQNKSHKTGRHRSKGIVNKTENGSYVWLLILGDACVVHAVNAWGFIYQHETQTCVLLTHKVFVFPCRSSTVTARCLKLGYASWFNMQHHMRLLLGWGAQIKFDATFCLKI